MGGRFSNIVKIIPEGNELLITPNPKSLIYKTLESPSRPLEDSYNSVIHETAIDDLNYIVEFLQGSPHAVNCSIRRTKVASSLPLEKRLLMQYTKGCS